MYYIFLAQITGPMKHEKHLEHTLNVGPTNCKQLQQNHKGDLPQPTPTTLDVWRMALDSSRNMCDGA